MTSISVRLNAYDPIAGAGLSGEISLESRRAKELALSRDFQAARVFLAPDRQPELGNPFDENVGWGLVIEESLDPLPEPLKRLVDARKAPVFRYRAEWEHSLTFLIDAKRGGCVPMAGARRGTGPECLPFYLMIYGAPDRVPWSLQFVLGANRCVGRLPLTGAALENYVNALLEDFKTDPSNAYHAVTWAVETHPDDITPVLRNQISAPVTGAMAKDAEMKSVFIDGSAAHQEATGERLIDALKKERPGLIVTTSHGMTGPLDNHTQMRQNLGVPVDQKGKLLDWDTLLEEWSPAGAIWYCHACCSAGCDAPSNFAALFSEQTDLYRLLQGIAGLGPSVAPLPEHLLGAKSPLRAFIGHVEPTFDLTLQSHTTGQSLTPALVAALYPNLYQLQPRMPVGLAFREWYGTQSPLQAAWSLAQARYDGTAEVVSDLLWYQLSMRDIQSTVILGDPAVMVPLRAA